MQPNAKTPKLLLAGLILAGLSLAYMITATAPAHRAASDLPPLSAVAPNTQLAQVSGSSCTAGDLTCGLVGWWKLDDGSGTTAADSSGNGNTGTLVNGPTWTTGKIGGALRFDGMNYVSTPNTVTVPASFTFSMWFKSIGAILGSGTVIGWSYRGFTFFYSNPHKISFSVDGSYYDGAIATVNVDDGQWHMITGTYSSGGTPQLFIDGSLNKISTQTQFNSSNDRFMIGSDNGTGFGYGGVPATLDDVRVYNRALSAAEVQSLYQEATAGGTTLPPTTYSLTVTNGGNGTVTSSPAGISCGSTCSVSGITGGTNYTLTAAPNTNFTASWSGCTSSSGNTCTITVNGNTTVTATFSQQTQTSVPAISNIYISQIGSGSGSSCVDALPVSWFNNSVNWGTGQNQIGPGDTVHLCGIISSPLIVEGDGALGRPIVIYFENGARISMPACPVSGCLVLDKRNYVTVDGGGVGVIESTANGTDFPSHIAALGISADNSGWIEIKGLTVQNMYVHSSPSDVEISPPGAECVRFIYGSHDISIHDDVLHDAAWCLNGGSTGNVNYEIYNNDIYNVDHGFGMGLAQDSGVATGISFYHNHVHDAANWDTTTDVFHHDAFHIWAFCADAYSYCPTTYISGIRIYDNLIDGDWGSCCVTGLLYFERNIHDADIFNNILDGSKTTNLPYGAIAEGGGTGFNIYNNTIIGSGLSTQMSPLVYLRGTGNFENDIVSSADQLVAVVDDAYSGQSSVWDFSHDIWANGGQNAFNWKSGNCQFLPFSQFTAWQTCSQDSDSLPVANADLSNLFAPIFGSPAIGAGINLTSTGVSGLGSDYAGSIRPSTGPWDVGAYQYAGNSAPNPPISVTSPTSTSVSLPSSGGSIPTMPVSSGGGGGGSVGSFTPEVSQAPVSSIGGGGTPIMAGTSTKACMSLSTIPASALSLTIGTHGQAVINLQTFLVITGYLQRQYITGYFGPLTKAALTSYQSAHPTSTCNLQPVTASGSQIPNFTRSLKLGMIGNDVKNLQIFLNQHNFTVSQSGAGSSGHETSYFGPATFRALIRFQNAYAAQILAPYGLSQGTGFFGPSSIKEANSLI
ncbi:hypothetical protein KGP36_07565 [Patescibacteria group bacterium]|nr:hypothetical protein [Patescibacteria group bacterium]